MNRLTKKQGNLYYPTNESYLIQDDGSNVARLLQVVGMYEDIEEELGISLPILFKALKDGIYYKSVNSGIHYISDTCLELEYAFGVFELWVDGHKTFDGLLIHLKDYKKTWALCEEDLKSE